MQVDLEKIAVFGQHVDISLYGSDSTGFAWQCRRGKCVMHACVSLAAACCYRQCAAWIGTLYSNVFVPCDFRT